MARLSVNSILCLWLPLLAAAALARPMGPGPALSLDITSSILQGRPIFGDRMGPYTAGQPLTLTCSTMDPSVTLTWWEGDKELKAESDRSQGISSASLTLEALSVSDSKRRLSCRAAEVDLERTLSLQVVPALYVIVDGELLPLDQTTVTASSGTTLKLTCISQGYKPSSTSWFEDNSKLESETFKSSFATSSLLTIPDITSKDTGRRFSCRSGGTELDRTFQFLVHEDKTAIGINEDDNIVKYNGDNNDKILQNILISVAVFLGILIISIIAIGIVCLVTKQKVPFNKLSKKVALIPSNLTNKTDYKNLSSSPSAFEV